MFEFDAIGMGAAPKLQIAVKSEAILSIEEIWFGSPFGITSRIKVTNGDVYLSLEDQSDLVKRLNGLLEK